MNVTVLVRFVDSTEWQMVFNKHCTSPEEAETVRERIKKSISRVSSDTWVLFEGLAINSAFVTGFSVK